MRGRWESGVLLVVTVETRWKHHEIFVDLRQALGSSCVVLGMSWREPSFRHGPAGSSVGST
jgi:hypothetical protein